jgi:hypothetical protein
MVGEGEEAPDPSGRGDNTMAEDQTKQRNEGNHDEDLPTFNEMLARANATNFDLIERSQCIGIGFDAEGRDTIYIIPSLVLSLASERVTESEILDTMILYFLKVAERIVHLPFNIVYGHSNFSFYRQFNTLTRLNNTLPRRYKKNLVHLFIVHPTGRAKMFARVASLFFGKKVEPKMRYVSCIAELQSLISPLTLPLPPAFLLWEDTVHFKRAIEEMPSLTELYDDSLGAPLFVVQCLDFLRAYGLHSEGLFRVAGDQILFEAAKIRIQRTGGTNVIICPPPIHSRPGNGSPLGSYSTSPSPSRDDIEEFKIDRQNTINSQRSIGQGIALRESPAIPPRPSMKQRAEGFNHRNMFPMADVVLHDVNEVAQVRHSLSLVPHLDAQLLKSFLRSLPEPVITNSAYAALIEASKTHNTSSSAEDALEAIEQILSDPLLMPEPHIRTLEYLMT